MNITMLFVISGTFHKNELFNQAMYHQCSDLIKARFTYDGNFGYRCVGQVH